MSKMKGTGIPWLPEISTDFSVGYVKQYFYVSKDLSNEGEPERVLKLARAGIVEKDVTTNEGQMAASYAGYNKVQVGDLLLNPMDLYSGANCNVSELSGVISPAYSNLRAKKAGSVVPKFYDYYFKSQYWLMAMFAHGKGVSFDNRWTLNNDSLRAYEIPVAPYAVQQCIVERIQSEERKVDALITNVQAQIEKLKAYKQSVISEAVTKGLDSEVPLKSSGVEFIGDIPEHWELRRMKTCCQIVDCKNRTPDPYPDGEYIVVRTTCIRNGNFTYEGSYTTDENSYLAWTAKGAPQYGDIFFTREAPMGEACLVPDDSRLCMGQRVMFFRPLSDFDSRFILYSIYGPLVREYIESKNKGSTVGHLKLGQVSDLPLFCCPLSEQKQIADYLDTQCSQIDRLIAIKQAKIEKLEQYKRSLIYEYVTGKREVV